MALLQSSANAAINQPVIKKILSKNFFYHAKNPKPNFGGTIFDYLILSLFAVWNIYSNQKLNKQLKKKKLEIKSNNCV